MCNLKCLAIESIIGLGVGVGGRQSQINKFGPKETVVIAPGGLLQDFSLVLLLQRPEEEFNFRLFLTAGLSYGWATPSASRQRVRVRVWNSFCILQKGCPCIYSCVDMNLRNTIRSRTRSVYMTDLNVGLNPLLYLPCMGPNPESASKKINGICAGNVLALWSCQPARDTAPDCDILVWQK